MVAAQVYKTMLQRLVATMSHILDLLNKLDD